MCIMYFTEYISFRCMDGFKLLKIYKIEFQKTEKIRVFSSSHIIIFILHR